MAGIENRIEQLESEDVSTGRRIVFKVQYEKTIPLPDGSGFTTQIIPARYREPVWNDDASGDQFQVLWPLGESEGDDEDDANKSLSTGHREDSGSSSSVIQTGCSDAPIGERQFNKEER